MRSQGCSQSPTLAASTTGDNHPRCLSRVPRGSLILRSRAITRPDGAPQAPVYRLRSDRSCSTTAGPDCGGSKRTSVLSPRCERSGALGRARRVEGLARPRSALSQRTSRVSGCGGRFQRAHSRTFERTLLETAMTRKPGGRKNMVQTQYAAAIPDAAANG